MNRSDALRRLALLSLVVALALATGCAPAANAVDADGPTTTQPTAPQTANSSSELAAPTEERPVATLDGQLVDPLESIGEHGVVFLFTRTDCPIANRYTPQIREIQQEYGQRGIAFRLVYPDADESPELIRKHLEEYELSGPALRDTHQLLARRLGATVTPEAAVLKPDGELIYRGRIDDRFIDFGKSRDEPKRHDLREVLDALLAGEAMTLTTTKAVGCFIPELQ